MFRAAYRSSSDAPNCICKPLLYIPMWWPVIPTQPDQRPVTTWVYKPEATNTVWSSWWWAVCRSKHVEPSINFGIIISVTRLHIVGCFYWFIRREVTSVKMKEREDIRCVSRNVSQKWETCLQAGGRSFETHGEISEGDLRGNPPLDTGCVLQMIAPDDSCEARWHLSVTQRTSAQKLQRRPEVRECIVVMWFRIFVR